MKKLYSYFLAFAFCFLLSCGDDNPVKKNLGSTTVAQKGDKGDKGDRGPQGPKGDKGDKGDAATARYCDFSVTFKEGETEIYKT